MSALFPDVEAKGTAPEVQVTADGQERPLSPLDDRRDVEAFLATFSAEEHNLIMRKVDRRFLLLIGLMYMLKNIDYMNAAVVKVLQVGEPRNILTELNMTPDEYNWVFAYLYLHVSLLRVPAGPINLLHQLHNFRSPLQLDVEEDDAPTLAITHYLLLGSGAGMPRGCAQQARHLRMSILSWRNGSWPLPRPGRAALQLVSQR